MAVDTLLALGSNLPNRVEHLAYAVGRLAEETELRALSSVYETDPVGYTEQGAFLNMVVKVGTDRSPEEVLGLARAVEAERGRVRRFRNSPRTLDIDVLLYGDREVRREDLVIPHPRMKDRPFVLVPLLELEPDARDPATGAPFREALARLAGVPRPDLREAGEKLGVRWTMKGEALLDELEQ